MRVNRLAIETKNRALIGWSVLAMGVALALAGTPSVTRAVADPPAAYARVGEVVITQAEYDEAFHLAAKRTFYHGRPPQEKVAQLQRDVGDKLINTVLLLQEARRRGMKADIAAVQKIIDGYEDRYRASAKWQNDRAQLLPGLKKRLEEENLLSQLEARAREVAAPSSKTLRAYYAAHPEKFTEPEQWRLSLILLAVDPSSPAAKWDAARAEARKLAQQLRGGSDFAALAKLHSGDASAPKGGDMGYTHRGMLPQVAQEAIDKLKLREISDPVTVLEGVAVFRLDERKAPKLNTFASVAERAKDLWLREQSDLAWAGLIARLRGQVTITIDESRYHPLGATPQAQPLVGVR